MYKLVKAQEGTGSMYGESMNCVGVNYFLDMLSFLFLITDTKHRHMQFFP